ncbi:hypothetical protein LINPERHAP2_LOCUS29818 [Linum perenne]
MSENKLTLPKYFALRDTSNGKYLKFDRTIYIDDDGDLKRGILYFTEVNVMSPYAKFETVPCSSSYKTGDELVHIRCCYNNKYWVQQSRAAFNGIIGGADTPDEDRSKWTCTLFKPVFEVDKQRPGRLVRLIRVHDNTYTSIGYGGVFMTLTANQAKARMPAAYEVVNMRDKITLPRYVVFKGDNGKYLEAGSRHYFPYWPGAPPIFLNYLKFCGNDRTEPAAVHEVLPNPDGTIRLKSERYKSQWEGWVFGDDEPRWLVTGGDGRKIQVSFDVVKLDGNVVAFKSSTNGKYCKRLSTYNISEGLAPVTDNIGDSCVRLTVEEPVVSRVFDNFDYHEGETRVHKQPVQRSSIPVDSYANHSKAEAWRKYSARTGKRSTSTWNRTITTINSSKWNADFEVSSLKIKSLPFEAKLGIHYQEVKELTDKVSWGETKEYQYKHGHGVNYKVPPMTKVTIYEKITNETRDVPFSYTQTDRLRNGSLVTYTMHDGLLTYTTTVIEADGVEEKLTS